MAHYVLYLGDSMGPWGTPHSLKTARKWQKSSTTYTNWKATVIWGTKGILIYQKYCLHRHFWCRILLGSHCTYLEGCAINPLSVNPLFLKILVIETHIKIVILTNPYLTLVSWHFSNFLKFVRGISNGKFHKKLIAPNQNTLLSAVWPQIQVFLSVRKLKFSEGGCEEIVPRDLGISLAQIAQHIKAVINMGGRHTKH